MSQRSKPAAKPLAELIGKALDPVVRKRGLARVELFAWWPDIVGAAYAERTAPERIRWSRDGAATLVVRCDPALALQFSYEADKVRERLNGYLGYPAVGAVRIVQRPFATGKEVAPEPAATADIPRAMAGRLDRFDTPLKDSLSALARAVIARS